MPDRSVRPILNGKAGSGPGGGDDTLSQVVNGIFSTTDAPQSALAVMPLGSANDFASAAQEDPFNSLAGARHALEFWRSASRWK